MSIVLHLVRHGQTIWNAEGRFLGSSEVPLNDTGKRQAQQLVQVFATVPLAAVYASNLSRAIDTATPTAEAHNLPVVIDARLRETGQGEFEGHLGTELRAQERYSAFFAAWQEGPADIAIPGGESLRDTLVRASASVAEIVAQHTTDAAGDVHILIVSHGLTLQVIIGEQIGLALEFSPRIRPQHGSVSTLVIPTAHDAAHHPTLLRLNDRHHLE